jgi:hypothetical protein
VSARDNINYEMDLLCEINNLGGWPPNSAAGKVTE